MPLLPVQLVQRLRRLHAALAPLVLLPLLLTVSTGVGYRLLRDWGGLDRDQAHLLMVLHEGEWLTTWFGPNGETVYVLLNGLGLLWMLISGGAMALQRLARGRG
ncbi:MAG: peptidase [Prochlorococcaceae cyanobacterium]